jgi:hypothetical protein
MGVTAVSLTYSAHLVVTVSDRASLHIPVPVRRPVTAGAEPLSQTPPF